MLDELALMEAQQQVHEHIAQQAPQGETFDVIARWMEVLLPDAIVAFMRFDADQNTLSLIPNPRFSLAYQQRLQAVTIGPDVASFGRAAFYRQPVITEDINIDPRWAAFRDVAKQEGLRACWSNPVLTTEGELLGTFGVYFREPRYPNDACRRRMRQAAALVALTILRYRDASNHRTLAEWHRSLFVNHPDGVYEFDLEGRFQRSNAALTRITGYPEEAFIGHHFNEFVASDYQEFTQACFDAARQGESRHYETVGICRDGHPYQLEILNFPVSVDGEVVGVYGICRDITAHKQEESSRRLLERGVQATPNGVVMADATTADMPIVFANDAFYELTGYRPEDVLGFNCRFLQGPDSAPEAVTAIRDAISRRQSITVTLRNYRKDGSAFWNHLSLSPIFDTNDNCTHYIGIQQDITQQREQEEQIAYQTTHDPLTGLPNRTTFDERLVSVFQEAQENTKLLTVMHLGLDGFKAVNDGLGYEIGNQLLKTVGDRLSQTLANTDILARLTGDEFALLTPINSQQAGIDIAERILDALSKPLMIDGHALHISASIGIACNSESISHAHQLMQRADLAMGEAKQRGRNTWHWYQGDQQRLTEESVLLRHDLHIALKEDQFELYYQPIVEAVNGRVRGLEALIRWHHPERGMVSPGVFIPLAEQTGQIIPLGRWILRRACEDIIAMCAASGIVVPVAVNISSLQFRRDGFLGELQEVLKETALPPELLELEITESVLLDGAEAAIELINALKKMGIRVALDDFGTGYSSLSYLRDLPIHKVKLDRAFIQDIVTNRRNAAIVQGIITMAHHLDFVVVAEGIEESEQQQDLVRRNCDLLQGYYFAKPMPRSAVMKLPSQLPLSAGDTFTQS